MDLAKQEQIRDVFIHAMLGRRGEMLESGANYIEIVEQKCRAISLGNVVSVIRKVLVHGQGGKLEQNRKGISNARLWGGEPRNRKELNHGSED
jgi:hypothetical protein